MKEEHVTVRWEIEDGYVGKARPQTTKIPLEEFEEDMSDSDILNLVEEYVEEDFRNTVFYGIVNEDEVVLVVQAHLARR